MEPSAKDMAIGLATWTKLLVKGPDEGSMEVLES